MGFLLDLSIILLLGSFFHTLFLRHVAFIKNGSKDFLKKVWKERSNCDYCHTKLSWIHLIPVMSWLMQQGKTDCCKNLLKRTYLLSELLCFFGGYLFIKFFSFNLMGGLLCLSILCWLWVLYLDWKFMLVPIDMILVICLSGAAYSFLKGNLVHNLISMASIAAVLNLVTISLYRLKGRSAMGLADHLLLPSIAFFLPLEQFPLFFIGIGCMGILIYSIDQREEIPFVSCAAIVFLGMVTILP